MKKMKKKKKEQQSVSFKIFVQESSYHMFVVCNCYLYRGSYHIQKKRSLYSMKILWILLNLITDVFIFAKHAAEKLKTAILLAKLFVTKWRFSSYQRILKTSRD